MSAPGDPPLLIVTRDCREEIRDAIGIEDGFVDAFHGRRLYRGRRGWCWDDTEGRVGLWMGGHTPILFCSDRKKQQQMVIPPPPRLRHQDAATRLLGSSCWCGYGSSRQQPKSFEEDFLDKLDGLMDLEHVLAETVYERWVDALLADTARSADSRRNTMDSLERNMEVARVHRHPIAEAYNGLFTRHLLRNFAAGKPSTHPNSAHEDDESKSPNDRALDRITYLGGLLLPLTVVASVLAIEGDYGPGGDSFWVFWLASAVGSLLAVLVIYVDQVRRVDVWEDVGGMMRLDVVDVEGGMIAGAERWRRGQMGWRRAVKRVSGLERWWPEEGIRFTRPSRET